MYKYHYDKIVESMSEKSKEELIQQILSLENIECSDRAFANQCEAGCISCQIDELFRALNEIISTSNIFDKYSDVALAANRSWDYIKKELHNMNDPSRISKELEEFKNRVTKAEDSYEII